MYAFDVSGSHHKKLVAMTASREGTEWQEAGEEGFLLTLCPLAPFGFCVIYQKRKEKS